MVETLAIWFWRLFAAFWVLAGFWIFTAVVVLPVIDRFRGRRPPLVEKYDDAGWYTDAGEEQAVAPMALYFRWCATTGFVSDEHTVDDEAAEQLAQVICGDLSASDYLWNNASGKLSSVDFTDEGNRFTRWFYGRRFLPQLAAIAGDFDVESDVDFAALRAGLDSTLAEWRKQPRNA